MCSFLRFGRGWLVFVGGRGVQGKLKVQAKPLTREQRPASRVSRPITTFSGNDEQGKTYLR